MRVPIASAAPHNNGMHPTADTTVLKFLQSLRATGDARRYAAVWLKGRGDAAGLPATTCWRSVRVSAKGRAA